RCGDEPGNLHLCSPGKEKRPASRAFPNRAPAFAGVTRLLDRADLRSRRALLALDRLVLDLLAFLERLEAVHLDFAVVGEEVLAAVSRRDEAEAFRVVEPFHGAFCHFNFLSDIRANPTRKTGSRTIK